jgi:2-dehydro-3-deoxygalactonokinase
LRSALVRFEAHELHVAIVPGASCTNRLGAPDVMRGEETQIVGALAIRPALATGRSLLCLPGTHTKWVCVEDGRIRDFLTAMTGELFALLRDHSMLAKAGATGGGAGDGFARGLDEAQAWSGGAGLIHALFGARSRQLIEGASKDWALAFVSGLLIGSDVGGAIGLFGGSRDVVLVGDPALNDLYVHALRKREIQALSLDGGDCSLAGLRSLATS